jgi:hypothetical protein
MPVGKTSAPPRQIIYLVVATIVGVVALGFLVLRTADLANRGDIQISIGDEVFAPGNVSRLSDDIERFGPLPLSDVSGGDRDIYLQHLGDDERDGWFAFSVRPLDASRECFALWQPEENLFTYERQVGNDPQNTEPCDDRTFPADGEGLFQYPVRIDDEGDLSVDLNAAEREADTSSTTDSTGG